MRILCWNVRGLGLNKKKDKVRWFLGSQRADLIILTETKLRKITNYTVRRIWGLSDLGFHYLPSNGSKGGILICWRRSIVSVTLPSNGRFTCSVSVQGKGDTVHWRLTTVYGPCIDELRLEFLDELLELQDLSNEPWCVMGDFNLIRFSRDKKGGCPISANMRRFNFTLASLKLNEIPLRGAKYTWVSSADGAIRSRIDRAFATEEWENLFPTVSLTSLPKPVSDHFPLLIDFGIAVKGPIPFKFCAWWLKEDGAISMIEQWWTTMVVTGNPGLRLWKKLTALKGLLQTWRKEVETVKRERSKQILGDIHALDLLEEERQLSEAELSRKESLGKEWAQIAVKEEEQLRLQSRYLWLTAGDSNSSFFHKLIKGRRKRNVINSLTIDGSILETADAIRVGATNYFEKFYEETYCNRPFPSSLPVTTLSEEQRDFCDADITDEEVFLAVKHSKGDKAPGPDGFSMDFYKLCWHFVKKEVLDFINEIQERNFIEWRLNNAFIALIPKKEHSSDIKDYRPISLINCGYKIFSKIMATRLRAVLQSTISMKQGAFLPRRQILDGVLIAAECIDSRLKGNNSGLLCKLDIEKAFDSVNWSFLQLVMVQMGFGDRFRRWIKISLDTGRFSVLVNGRPGGLFKAQRGVRQGDPVSPYLFLIAMEIFSLMIETVTAQGKLHGFRPGKEEVVISHLQFADDTMVFLDSNIEEVRMLKHVLRGFELTSGLRINYFKTSLIPIGQCMEIEQCAAVLGCRVGNLPFSYLGLPLGAKFKAITIWTPFVERLESRLASWRRCSLSKGGRIVLIKSCLMSLPVYYLSMFPIPALLAHRMEKLARNFLWGESTARRPRCWISWEKCKRPKSHGGLGIRGFSLMNKALLSKWIWRYVKEGNALWRKVICSKYGSENGGVFPKQSRGSHGVGVWKQICRQASFIHDHSSFMIGNGNSARFWFDKWCSDRPLRIMAPNLFSIVRRKHALVSDVVKTVNGQITINMQFYFAVEDEFLNEVVLIHNLIRATPLEMNREDVLVWGTEDDPNDAQGFSVAAAHMKLIQPTIIDIEEFPWKMIWRKHIPLKVQFFSWTASLHRIATFDLMRIKRIIWVNCCLFCVNDEETAPPHLLIHCPYVSEIWWTFLRAFGVDWVMPYSVLDLLSQWNLDWPTRKGRIIWSILAHAIIWSIWEERNSRSYDGREGSSMKVVMAARGLVGYWCSSVVDFKDLPVNNFLFLFDRIIRS